MYLLLNISCFAVYLVDAIFCSSAEAISLLAAAGFITMLIVAALCYIRWHGKFSKWNSSDCSDTAKNSQSVIPQMNERKNTLSPETPVHRYVFCHRLPALKQLNSS
jgi:hypothetical protein